MIADEKSITFAERILKILINFSEKTSHKEHYNIMEKESFADENIVIAYRRYDVPL